MPLNLYKASAGAGKTHTLTQTYLKLLTTCAPKNILAVTFTNKATQEMKERILDTLHKIACNVAKEEINQAHLSPQTAQNNLAALLHDFSHFNVSTIDGFYQQVMRAFVRELGLSGSYTLVLDPKEVLNDSIDDLILSLEKEENKHLYQWLLERAKDNIKEDKDWQFRKDLTKLGKQLFNEEVANAIQQLSQVEDILTHINNLKQELSQTRKNLIKDIQDKAKKVLHLWDSTHWDRAFATSGTITQCEKASTDDHWPAFGANLQKAESNIVKIGSATKLKNFPQWETTLSTIGIQEALQDLMDFWRNQTVAYYTATAVLHQLDLIPVLLELNRCIANHLTTNNLVLLSQVNAFLRQMINDCDTPFIYEKMGYYIQHFMLDEFQDTSTLQWENFKPLISNSLGSNYSNMIVGDIKQSIYRWRNSDWRILAGIQADLGQHHTVNDNSDEVKTNWRSYKNIVAFNNHFYQKAPHWFQATLPNDPTSASRNLIADLYSDVEQQVAPKNQDKEGLVHITWLDAQWKSKNDKPLIEETIKNQVLNIVQQALAKQYQYKDIAILVNTHKEGETIVQWLMAAKIPVISSESLLLKQSSVVRLLIAIIRISCSFQPEVDQYKLNILKELKDPHDNKFEQIQKAMRLPLFEAVEQYIQLLNLGGENNDSAYLQTFQDVVSAYVSQNSPDATAFIQWWDETGHTKTLPANEQLNAVQISTIHKSKGLAYPIVIMPFCNPSIWKTEAAFMPTLWVPTQHTPYEQVPVLPLLWDKNMEQSAFKAYYEEEKLYQSIDFINKWYVAFTRPQYALYLIGKQFDKPDSGKKGYAFLWDMAQAMQLPLTTGHDGMVYTQIGELPINPEIAAAAKKAEEQAQKQEEDQPPAITQTQLPYHSYPVFTSNRKKTTPKQHQGNTLHAILQHMVTAADADKAIAKAQRMGLLKNSEVAWAQAEIAQLLKNPSTQSWFDGTFPTVWNERSILTNPYTHDTDDNETGKYRPDRLLVKDKHIVVVDYKFGKESSQYIAQMQRYMESLRDMERWDKIEGFLYYHESGRILPVSI